MRTVSSLIVLIIAHCVVVYSAELVDNPNADPEYREFKRQFGIGYRSKAKEQQKYAQFKRNKAMIEEHNVRYERGEESYKMGLNQFGDSTLDEMAETSFGVIDDDTPKVEAVKSQKATTTVKLLKDKWDWRDHDGVTSVKNQYNCGSCWAFAASAVIESQYMIRHGGSPYLCEDALVKCVGLEYGGHGCYGGSMSLTLQYIKKYGMMPMMSFYKNNKTCEAPKSVDVFGKGGTVRSLIGKDINTIKNAVYTYGPCTAGMYWTDGLKNYQSGVYPNKIVNAYASSLKHAVALVGYGKENGKEFLTFKNSWGLTWGESGYFRVEITSKDDLMITKNITCYEMPPLA